MAGIPRGRVVGVALAVLALLLLGWGSAVGAGGPSVVRAQATDTITVTVSDSFQFTPDHFEVTPGHQVTLTLEQLDGFDHTFTLSSATNFSFTNSNTTADLQSFFVTHPPLAYVHFNLTTGEKQTRSFVAPKLGTYEFVCEIGGHFQKGMVGMMGSGVAVGPPSGPPVPTGLYLIVGGIVGLVVLAIVLGFVVGRREGARHEMPPERLGYSEPAAPGGALPPGKPPGSGP